MFWCQHFPQKTIFFKYLMLQLKMEAIVTLTVISYLNAVQSKAVFVMVNEI